MLVPTSGINVKAAPSAANTRPLLPQPGGRELPGLLPHQFDRRQLDPPDTVLGNGAVKSVSDPSAGTSRFYKVTAP